MLHTGIASMTEQPRRFENESWQLVVYSPNNFLFINMFDVKTFTGKWTRRKFSENAWAFFNVPSVSEHFLQKTFTFHSHIQKP